MLRFSLNSPTGPVPGTQTCTKFHIIKPTKDFTSLYSWTATLFQWQVNKKKYDKIIYFIILAYQH